MSYTQVYEVWTPECKSNLHITTRSDWCPTTKQLQNAVLSDLHLSRYFAPGGVWEEHDDGREIIYRPPQQTEINGTQDDTYSWLFVSDQRASKEANEEQYEIDARGWRDSTDQYPYAY